MCAIFASTDSNSHTVAIIAGCLLAKVIFKPVGSSRMGIDLYKTKTCISMLFQDICLHLDIRGNKSTVSISVIYLYFMKNVNKTVMFCPYKLLKKQASKLVVTCGVKILLLYLLSIFFKSVASMWLQEYIKNRHLTGWTYTLTQTFFI